MEFSYSQMKYIFVIYDLSKYSNKICASDVAKKLSVSRASVSKMIKVLNKRGIISKEYYKKIMLTQTGKDIAEKYLRHYELIVSFLDNNLNIPNGKTEDSAIKILCALSLE